MPCVVCCTSCAVCCTSCGELCMSSIATRCSMSTSGVAGGGIAACRRANRRPTRRRERPQRAAPHAVRCTLRVARCQVEYVLIQQILAAHRVERKHAGDDRRVLAVDDGHAQRRADVRERRLLREVDRVVMVRDVLRTCSGPHATCTLCHISPGLADSPGPAPAKSTPGSRLAHLPRDRATRLAARVRNTRAPAPPRASAPAPTWSRSCRCSPTRSPGRGTARARDRGCSSARAPPAHVRGSGRPRRGRGAVSAWRVPGGAGAGAA